jgi:very-short-patch-repair endonuclease
MADRDQTRKWRVSEKLRKRAKDLRRDMTEAERIIWYNVRSHRLQGAGFRRQTPIGPYVVDFVCHEAKVIIEVDGGQHFESGNIARDARRQAYLEAQGYRVLRFNNRDVMTNKAGVLVTIAAVVGRAPSLALPRKRGRGQGSADSQGSARHDHMSSLDSASTQDSANPQESTSTQDSASPQNGFRRRADGRDLP